MFLDNFRTFAIDAGEILDTFKEFGRIKSFDLPHRSGQYKNGHSKYDDVNA